MDEIALGKAVALFDIALLFCYTYLFCSAPRPRGGRDARLNFIHEFGEGA